MKKSVVFLGGVLGFIAGVVGQGFMKNKVIREKNNKVDKFKSYYNMLNQWLVLKQEGKSLEQYFVGNNIKTIAIYGMGEMGNRLYDELKESSIEVKYAIDKDSDSTYAKIDVIDMEDSDLPEVDAVVVSAIFAFDEIEEKLTEVIGYNIVSLEDVVYGI